MASAVLVGVLPGFVLLVLFYFLDRYEREPVGHVVAAALLGVVAVPVAFATSKWVGRQVGQERLALMVVWGDLIQTFVVVALVEEGAKWLIMVASVLRWREFDEPYDGIIYGAALAIGFATVENVLYLWRTHGADLWHLAFLRGVLSVPAHALYGASMGALLGRGKFSGRRASAGSLVVLALFAPWALHGGFDVLCLYLRAWWGWWALVGLSGFMWALVALFVFAAWARSPFRGLGPSA